MTEQRTRRDLLAGLGTAGGVALAGCLGVSPAGSGGPPGDGSGGPGDGGSGTAGPGSDGPVTVFHAGSLAPPFSAAEPGFESTTGIDVTREAQGSVASTKKVTVQGRPADCLGVADFRLLRDRLLPDYGDWYAVFATNAMAIQYREDSPGADEIGTDNWWEVLSREGVTVGHSDPAIDPGGYRAVMAQELGAIPFQGDRLYDRATYERLRANSTVPTGTEINLERILASGKIDYALYYRSIASVSEFPQVDLQAHVDLSEFAPEYAAHYASAEVETRAGTFTGAPIAYGITVPSVARDPAAGAQFVEHFVGGEGREALREKELVPLDSPVVPESSVEAVPDRVLAHVEPRASLGPMDL